MSWIFRGRTWKARRAFHGSGSDTELPRAADHPRPAAQISGPPKKKMPRLSSRHFQLIYQQINSRRSAYPLRAESVRVPARKTLAVCAGVVAKARIMKVMRSFRIVASTMLRIAPTRLQTVMITLVCGSVRTTKDVFVVVAVPVIPVRIPKRIPVIRPIEWTICLHDHDSTLLRLSRRARQ